MSTAHERMADLMEQVIRTAYAAGFEAAQTAHMTLDEHYTDWRQCGPGALLPFGLGASRKERQEAALAEMASLGVERPEVCMTHMQFVPCRDKGGYRTCWFSDMPRDVRIVQEYQRGLRRTNEGR